MLESSILLKIADLYFKFHSNSKRIDINPDDSVRYFTDPSRKIYPDYYISFKEVSKHYLSGAQLVFSGEPERNDILNYSWFIYRNAAKLMLDVEFTDHPQIKSIVASISENISQVNIDVLLKDNVTDAVLLDPLIHPLGSLLLLYLMHWKQGLLIHGSAVSYNNDVFLFTGVSGIGKSTMARLWKENGATILNDDRLVIRLIGNQVKIYNNPMPYYLQRPQEGLLRKIFLLKQSPDNYIKPLKGVEAYSRVLGNFIQQFYRKEMVAKHLTLVEQVINKVKIYEVGFKPDQDIVNLIKTMDRDE